MDKEIDYAELDPGIREAVKRARAAGFDTTDSGDGVSKPREWVASGDALPYPHIACAWKWSLTSTVFGDAERLKRVLGDGWEVQASYSTADQSVVLFATRAVPQAVTEKHTDDISVLREEWLKSVAPEPPYRGVAADAPIKVRRDSFREGYASALRRCADDLEKLGQTKSVRAGTET